MSALTPTLILTAFIVFCRIGGCLLVIPGFSSPRVPIRARLFVAIAVSLALTPLMLARVEPAVASAAPVTLLGLILSEGLKGVLIGLLGRFFFVALETMAMAISLSIGLASIIGVPMEGDEAMPPLVSIVSVTAVLLVFVTDLHWEVFRGLAASYDVLPVNAAFDPRVGTRPTHGRGDADIPSLPCGSPRHSLFIPSLPISRSGSSTSWCRKSLSRSSRRRSFSPVVS